MMHKVKESLSLGLVLFFVMALVLIFGTNHIVTEFSWNIFIHEMGYYMAGGAVGVLWERLK